MKHRLINGEHVEQNMRVTFLIDLNKGEIRAEINRDLVFATIDTNNPEVYISDPPDFSTYTLVISNNGVEIGTLSMPFSLKNFQFKGKTLENAEMFYDKLIAGADKEKIAREIEKIFIVNSTVWYHHYFIWHEDGCFDPEAFYSTY